METNNRKNSEMLVFTVNTYGKWRDNRCNEENMKLGFKFSCQKDEVEIQVVELISQKEGEIEKYTPDELENLDVLRLPLPYYGRSLPRIAELPASIIKKLIPKSVAS
ncbi:hypothetical protein KC929_00205 [Patescibacteria group bacterium]|nr:hypothetical protein [Patescibacteria group bacterium]